MNKSAVSADGPIIWDAASYDGSRRRLIPYFDLLYGTAATLVEMLPARPVRVLDLGAGTGLLSAAVRERRPDAELTLLDGSESMLARAVQRFPDAVDVVVRDLTDPLPAGPYDAIISSLAIHHLADSHKQVLFERVYATLPPGGLFVNLEQVAAPTPALQEAYEIEHERSARTHGCSDAEWDAAQERMSHDRCAPLDSQLGWLRAAGFATVDCLAKTWRFAVYAGWR